MEKLGEKVVPYLEPYLNDENNVVKREAVLLAVRIGGEKSLAMVALAFQKFPLPLRKIVADNLYANYSKNRRYSSDAENPSPEKIAARPQIGVGLQELAKSGRSNVGIVFLLANFSGDETERILRSLITDEKLRADENDHLEDGKNIKLAAAIVLANSSDREAAQFLSEKIEKKHAETLTFLLENVVEIESRETLAALSKTLDDQTIIVGGTTPTEFRKKLSLPKGMYADPPPRRRVCDLAVNSFVKKFDLKIAFRLHTTKYSGTQIAEVRELLNKTLAAK